MTSPAPMSREELLELAALDALGLLDEYEAALYTRSFHHAPAAVQDEIKDLQATFATPVVTLTLQAMTDREDPHYTHPVEGDGYRRRVQTSTIEVRNLTL